MDEFWEAFLVFVAACFVAMLVFVALDSRPDDDSYEERILSPCGCERP